MGLEYLTTLNKAQKEAVIHADGPILILAGAGSGKTRVLTHRICHLIFEHRVDPRQILAVTFTNKAAAEMRHRVCALLEKIAGVAVDERDLWISTFHSACVKILRSEIKHLGYNPSFTIYDDSDQLSVIKAVMKELNISDSSFSPKAVQAKINKSKNDGVNFEDYDSSFGGPFEDAFVRIFERYANVLKASSAVDFGDIILLTVKLFRTHPPLLKAYQNRFQHILIDEYQDTNKCQYNLVKLLAGERANICAVGDEDQSIYKWRGADIQNILNFEKDFSNARIYKLEQNYRSSKNIIEAASHVISQNTERRDKQLWTDNYEGEKIKVIEAYDEHDEAQKVTSEISNQVVLGESLNQIAIFYRTNAQSRVLEDILRAKGMNYQIYGGLKFYDRLEVKDMLAYLKLLANPNDDVSFRRIINVPTRGIGAVSLEKFTYQAQDHGTSLYPFLVAAFGPSPTVHLELGRSQKQFHKFYELVEKLRAEKGRLLPSDLYTMVLEESGYRESLVKEQTVEAQSRLENLAELRQSIVEFELRWGAQNPDKPITLESFLEEIALVSDIDRFDPDAPAVKLMTIHMAKGLEFDVVFVVGLEEELFPNVRPWEAEDPSDVEEERRLFYVGMTRARKKLHLVFAKNRTVFGNSQFRVMSRFIEEVPEKYTEFEKADYFARRRKFIDRPGLPFRNQEQDEFYQPSYDDLDERAFKKGRTYEHPIFGKGTISQVLGDNKLIVSFPEHGEKKIKVT
jgi:DNA helicase-2/ATP-dependent DNA helicase PcrA